MHPLAADALIASYLVQRRARFAARQLLGLRPLLSRRDAPTTSSESLEILSQLGLDRRALLRWRLGLLASHFRRPQAAWCREVEREACARADSLPDGQAHTIPRIAARTWRRPGYVKRRMALGRPFVLERFAEAAARDPRWTVPGLLERCRGEQVLLTHRDGRIALGAFDELATGDCYLHNGEAPFKRRPDLGDELGLDALRPHVAPGRQLTSELFLGRAASTTNLHLEGQQLWHLMLDGHKRWTVVEPSLSPLLGVQTQPGKIYLRSRVGSPTSPRPDSAALFRVCPRHVADIEPGDALYLPPFWWHSIDNPPRDTLAVTTRWTGGPETSRFFAMMWYVDLPLTRRYVETLRLAIRDGERGTAWQEDGRTLLEEVSHAEGIIDWLPRPEPRSEARSA